MRLPSRHVPLVVVAILTTAPAALHAQNNGNDPWFAGFPTWTVDLYAGLANQGRFLLQAVDDDLDLIIRQRRLVAPNGFSWGLAVGVNVLPLTQLRLAFSRTSGDLDYEDDTGTGSDTFDVDDVAGLSSSVLGLEARRFL
ncbi:MAG TPA: hypothetical protein VNZ55_07655, partial [Thermomicrobiales bacterium]|nr:hypothetical protein [Thermomicrobiales bacterium]